MADAKKSKIYNNPGNIEVGQGYAGETGTYANDRERPFAIFDTPQMGVRALTRDLITKIKRFDGDVDAIINQYAPNNENDTKAYQKFIKQQIGNKSKVDESDLPSLITGIIKKENKGSTADYYLKDPKIIEEGIALSSKSFPSNYTYRDALLEYLTPLPIETRQEGGPVNAGQPYLVGEEGPELVIPNQDAFVLPTNSPETQAALDALSAGVSSDVAGARALGQSLRGSSQSIADMVPQKSPTRNKVKYIKFDDPNAPRIAVPEEFDQEQIKEYLKSESVEAQMYDRGYLYKYGLQPSYYQDNSNLDDWALTAGIKSGYDNLKAIGTGALYTVADTFGSEENMAKFERLREQYNQDAAVHIYKEGEGPGGVESRITSIEDALQSEAKLSAFLDWAAFNTGAGATTMIPIIMASAVGAGVGVAAAPFTGGASLAASGASIAGMMAAYSMGVGEATGAQLDRSGDANAALSLAAGIPYAAAERLFGTSFMLNRLFAKKYGAELVEDIVKKTTIKSLSEKKIKNSIIKEVSKGFGKQFVGEGITEATQEAITSTVAEINEGASLAELYSSKDFWKQLGESAAAGAVAGGVIGGVTGGPIQYIRKAGNKNIDATAALADKVDTDNIEAINATGGEVGDIFTYTGLVNDTEDKTENSKPKEYTLLGTTITTKGDEVYVMTPVGGGAPVLVPLNESSKLAKSQLNAKDIATLGDQQFAPEDTTSIPKATEVNQAVKDLKARGIVNSEQSVEDLVGLPPLDGWLEEESEQYQDAITNQAELLRTEGEVTPLPAKYKQYQGLEGETFNKVAEKQYQKERKQGIVNFYNTTLASENQLTDQEKLELQKLGYYKGPRGIEFINRKLANTNLKDKAKVTTGLQELREIISNQIAHTPQIVESNRVVSRTQVPPLIPRSFEETKANLDPDSAARLETLTEQKQRYDWELAKQDEIVEQLKNDLETLDPNSPNIETETTRLQNEINFVESRRQAVAREVSDPLTRILKIRDITTHMNNSGFRVSMLQYYRQILKQVRKNKDEVAVQVYTNLIKNYRPTNQHVFTFNNTLVFLFTSKAKQQLQFDAKQLENSIKDLLPDGFSRSAYRTLTEDNKVLYRQYSRDLQKRLNAIKTIDSKRVELNNLLASFNIEPIINWDKQKGKLSIPEFNSRVKELLGYEKVEREKVIEEYWSLSNHPDSLDRPALSQDAIDKMPMVLEDMRSELERLGVNNLDLRIYNSITNKKGAQVNGRFLGGLGLVEVAMNATQNVNGSKLNPADSRMFTLHHESMHYIFKNLLTPEEQATLKSAARDAYIKRYNIKKRYEGFGLSEEALLEESISDAFAEYMATTSNGSLYTPKGMIATIFNRIRNYIIALGNALSNNQLRSTAQIFNNIDKGVMEARRDIINKVDISRSEMLNLAKIGKISVDQAEKFFNQRGRSVVLVGGIKAGSTLTNKQLYRSFIINILPKFYAVRQDPATNKIVTSLSNLFESITTDTGVPNLEQANFYLQQLNTLNDQDLNAVAAYLQSNQEAMSEVTSAALMKSSMGTYAGQDVAALFELMQAPDLFKTRLARLNRNMPTETDIRIAGTPLTVHHGTGQTAMASIMAGGFIASPNSMGMHFGTQAQATIRGKAMADADYQGTGLDAGKGLKTPEWWKPTSDLSAAIPSADTTRKTQRANTAGTYNKIKSKLKEGNTLDFGAGLGLGTEILKSDSFEPFPPANFVPTYQAVQQIPENSYDNIVSLNVLNVLPKASRNDAVRTIGRSLKVNGTAFITTRGMDIYGNKQNPARGLRSDEVGSIITADGQSFQKGFTQAELTGYIQSMLGSGFSVEAIPEGAAGVKVTKLETSLTTPGILNAVLHIRNPIRMQDMGAQWDSFQVLNDISAFPTDPNEQYGMDIDVSRQMAPAMLTDIIFTPTEATVVRNKMTTAQDKGVPFKQGKSGKIIINKNYKPASLIRQEILQDAIKAKGYDGIVYRNQYEVTADYDGDGGAIESLDSYIVFSPNQIQLVENNPNLDMSDIHYSASSEGSYEADPSDDKISQPDPKENRSATKEANKGMDDGGKAEDKVLAGTTPDTDVSLKDIGKVSKFMMHARGLAAKFPVVARMFRAVQGLEQKGRALQTQFAAQMRNYFDVINRMEGAKEILAKAHIISQQAGAQARYRKDAEGRITFVSPISITTGGESSITIMQGEVVVLDGALADVYEDSQGAIMTVLDEIKKGTIASTFVPQLKQSVEILSRMNPEALAAAGIDPNTFDGDVVENLQYGQLVAIINGLAAAPQLVRDRAMSASMNNPTNLSNMVERLPIDSATIDILIGTDATNLPSLLQELRKFEELKQFDYVPLQRYGTHAITVKDESDQVVRYEHISVPLKEEKLTGMTTSRKFGEVRSRLLAEYPASEGFEVSQVEEISEDYRSRMPKDLSMIDSMAQHLSDKNAKKYDEVRKELDTIIGTQNVVGFDKFVRGRKMIGGVPGFDGDILRSISQFGMIAAEYGARNRYLKDVNNSYSDAMTYTDINKMPNLREAVEKMKAYGIDNMHSHEFTLPRRLGFWWFLGGNISSGILQTMSMVQFTGPMLAQFSNSAKSSTQLSRAFVEVNRLLTFTDNQFGDVFLNLDKPRLMEIFKDEALVEAISEDIANGIIKQGQALYETGQAPGFTLTPTDKTNMKIRGRIKQLEQGVMGGTFNTFETISRLTAYVAAYRLSQDPKTMQNADTWYSGSNFIWNEMKKQRGGMANSQDFARILIDDTFGDYSKINRPMIMRGAGSIFFLFQTYISQMFGLLRRLMVGQGNAQSTAMGRKMFARIMLMLFLTGGLMGLPGADDLDFLYRMTRKMQGVDQDMRTVMREALVDLTGPKMTEAIMNGSIEAFGNVNVQRRLSLGEVPGSGQARAILSALGMPTGAKAEEFLGAPGAVFFQSGREMFDIINKQGMLSAATDMDLYMAAAPTFIKNAYRAAYKYPQQGYVDTRRGTLLTADLNGFDLLMQGIGFTPTKISKARNVLYYERQVDTKYQGITKSFNSQIKNAFRDMYIGYNITDDKAMADAAQLEILKIMRQIQEFNNGVDSNYAYVPAISRLRAEGIKQANFNLRTLKANKKTFRKKQELTDQFDVNMN